MRQIVLYFVVFALAVASNAAADSDWEQMLPVEQIQEDFAALYQGLKSGHANIYAQRSATEYDQRYDAMLAAFTTPMRRFDVQMAFARFAAFGNVAHAKVDFPSEAFAAFREAGGRTFPIYLRIADGTAYVGQNLSGNSEILAGDEIVTLNDAPMARWLERTATHTSADTPYIAHSLLEFTFPRDLWAVIGEIDTFDLTLRRDGKTFDVTVAAATRDAQRAAAADLPSVFGLDSNERMYRMLNPQLAYLRPGPFYNVEMPTELWDSTAFVAFVDQAFEHFLEQEAETLIIDLRQNPGGDNSFSDPMVAWIADEPFRFCSEFLVRSSDEAAASNALRLEAAGSELGGVSAQYARDYARVPRGQMFSFDIPFAQPREGRRFEGRVYALINRHTYSNAVNVAAMLQDYGFGIIAGEKTADMATTYGAMERFTLANSGIEVGFPKAHIIRPSGQTRPDGVTPDLQIATPVVGGNDDAVLGALIERIQMTDSKTR